LLIKTHFAGTDNDELENRKMKRSDSLPGDLTSTEICMMKRSFFLTVVAGLLASLAFAAPSQAGSVVTTTLTFTVTPSTASASDLEVTYSPDVSGTTSNVLVAANGGLSSPAASISGDTLTVNFTPAAATTSNLIITFDTTLNDPITFGSFNITGVKSGATATGSISVTAVPQTIPEPTTIAMLGIGMTGLLAFRRLFKRTSVA
jgi:hypothetical protein